MRSVLLRYSDRACTSTIVQKLAHLLVQKVQILTHLAELSILQLFQLTGDTRMLASFVDAVKAAVSWQVF